MDRELRVILVSESAQRTHFKHVTQRFRNSSIFAMFGSLQKIVSNAVSIIERPVVHPKEEEGQNRCYHFFFFPILKTNLPFGKSKQHLAGVSLEDLDFSRLPLSSKSSCPLSVVKGEFS